MPKRVVVLATSPLKSRLLVLGEKNFHALNTEDDWPIGKKRKAPRVCVQTLIYDALLGIPCKKYLRSCDARRVILPSGTHCYVLSDEKIADCVESCRRVRKKLGLCDNVHFHSIEKMRSSQAFEFYTPITIEAIQCIFGSLPLL